MKPLLALFAAAAFGVPALASADTVFKWVDANGVTNYTTTPPPASAQKVSAVNASPAINNLTAPSPGSEEALYWRERRMRETANDIGASRNQRESEEVRNQLARQQLASAYDEELRRRAQDARIQSSFDQCMLERRIDCAYGYDSGSTYGYPVVVAGRGPVTIAPTLPLPGQRSLTTQTPGAPFIPIPPRPPARPVLAAKLGGGR